MLEKKLETSSKWAIPVYKLMAKIRIAEELTASHYLQNKIFSFVHFCIGQELAPAAFGYLCESKDRTFGNHRSHGHFLAKGGSAHRMFSEMLGKRSGSSSGKGGSMHLIDLEVGFAGTSPILSSSLPLAAGSAWVQKASGSGGITIVYTGDGASEEGNFYETLNIAALWKLPLIIVVENNLYSVNTPASARRPQEFSMENLARSLGVDYFFADGTDPASAMKVFENCYSLAKATSRPCLVEVRAFRHLAHSSPLTDDKLGYRVEDTEDIRLVRDPIKAIREHLVALDFSALSLDLMWTEIEEELRSEFSLALSEPNPSPDELFYGLYA